MAATKRIFALGFFDGVHLGHQALLRTCRALADQYGYEAGAVTFGVHPDTLIRGSTPPLISTVPDREWLLREVYHMDTVVTLPFDERLRTMPWLQFLRMLSSEYGAAGFVCGEDFRFGTRGEGSAALLAEYCATEWLPCAIVPEQTLDGIRISSTHIRKLIEDGKMESATRFLGHPYRLTGTVVHGHRLGRKLGFPTANLRLPPEVVVPRFGVYACYAVIDGIRYPAVTNVGTRPTVEGTGITVEPWILDFQGDLYDRQIMLEFYRFLRPEMKFPDLASLQQEILRNEAETRAYLKSREELTI